MPIYGIDLGTCNTCVACCNENGDVEIIKNFEENSNVLPSAVYFQSNSELDCVVGSAALEYYETEPYNVALYAKRYIGKEEEPSFYRRGTDYSATQISSFVLKKAKEMVESQGKEIVDVVITVPAYFGYVEQEATKEAAKLAGLNVVALVKEPTAAALYYCYRNFKEDQTLLVYDLGGGTFDVSIIRTETEVGTNNSTIQVVRVVKFDGNDRLGGADWNEALYEYVCDRCVQEAEITRDELDSPEYGETRATLRDAVEDIKKKLSNTDSRSKSVKVGDRRVNLEITRETFEELTSSLVDQTFAYVNKTLQESNLTVDDIDVVLLVGGSTKMPMIRRRVEEFFGKPAMYNDPDEAVAKGAAIYALSKCREETDVAPQKQAQDDLSDPIESQDWETEQENDSKYEENDKFFEKTPYSTATLASFKIIDQAPRSFGINCIDPDGFVRIHNIVKMGQSFPIIEAVFVARLSEGNGATHTLKIFENKSTDDVASSVFDVDSTFVNENPDEEIRELGTLVLTPPEDSSRGDEVKVYFTIQDGTEIEVRFVHCKSNTEVEGRVNFD